MAIIYTYSIVTVGYTGASHVSLLKIIEDVNKRTFRNSDLQWGKTLCNSVSVLSLCVHNRDSWSGMCLASFSTKI